MTVYNHLMFPSIITEVNCSCFDILQPYLIDWIYNYKKQTDGVIISNRGGWQSPSDFWHQQSFLQYYNYLCTHIFQSINFYNLKLKISNMWININQKGDYNVEHDHPNSILSGVLWIKCPENCGGLQFNSSKSFLESYLLQNADDDFRRETNYYNTFTITPKNGVILLFPSHMRHSVEENTSNEDRISISFNLVLQ